MNSTIFIFFLPSRDYRTTTSGWQGGTVFQEIRPGAGFETGDFVEEMLEGLPWNGSGGEVPIFRLTGDLPKNKTGKYWHPTYLRSRID